MASSSSQHPLQHQWCLWVSQRNQRRSASFEEVVKPVGTLSTAEDFWAYFSHMTRPCDLPVSSDYHLFVQGIKPMWEDDHNKNGGKWIVRLRKGLASRYWESLALALVGDQFDVGDEICGAVVSIRFHEDIIAVWNKTTTNQDVKLKIGDTLRTVLNLPSTAAMEYKNHNASLQDKSSFRNTDVFR
eukprot:m.42052 g.42052  ORF g.42052 m.42052 type:complete len:186 (+) comp12068_c0_seq1:147-704(+)